MKHLESLSCSLAAALAAALVASLAVFQVVSLADSMAFWLSFLFISLLRVNIEIHHSFFNSAGPDVVEELTYEPDSRKLVHGFSLKVQDLNMVEVRHLVKRLPALEVKVQQKKAWSRSSTVFSSQS